MHREAIDLRAPAETLVQDARRDQQLAAMQHLFDSLPHPVTLRRRAGGALVYANEAWRRLLTCADEATARRTEQRLLDADLAVLRTGQPVITEERIPCADGERLFVGHSTPVQGTGGLPDMVCSVWTDIEDQAAQIRALRQALENRTAHACARTMVGAAC